MTNPYSVPMDDLEAEARVPLEEQVVEHDDDHPDLPGDAETERRQVLRTIAMGG